MAATMVECYGEKFALQCESIRQRIIEYNRKTYGVDWYIQSEDFKEKRDTTNMALYGTSNPGNLPEFQEKAHQTSMKNWGVDNPSKSEIIRQKVKETNLRRYGNENGPGIKKVLFDGIWFDSNWEVIFYRWLKYKNMEFKYHPISIPYMIGETKHFYFPDFVVGEQLYEVKGNYFFNEHGQLIDPYDGYKLRLEKQQCMIENNVIILMSSEIEGIEKDLTNNTNNFTLPII